VRESGRASRSRVPKNTVVDDVRNLLGDLIVGQRRQEREGLEELVVRGLKFRAGSASESQGVGRASERTSIPTFQTWTEEAGAATVTFFEDTALAEAGAMATLTLEAARAKDILAAGVGKT
jgi:hypothetical protein